MLHPPLLGLFAVLALSWSTRADACSYVSGFQLVAPADGATEVPRNTRIWGGLYGGETTAPAEDYRLVASDGEEVPLSLGVLDITSDGGQLVSLTPQRLLRPRTRYEFQERGNRWLAFTTSLDEDNTPPAIPTETGRRLSAHLPEPPPLAISCGITACRRGMDFILDANEFVLLADINRGSDLSMAATSGPVHQAHFFSAMMPVGLGTDCPAQDTDQIRFGALDLAGNFSGWGEESTVGQAMRCACSSTSGGATASLALLGVLGGMCVRRVRRDVGQP